MDSINKTTMTCICSCYAGFPFTFGFVTKAIFTKQPELSDTINTVALSIWAASLGCTCLALGAVTLYNKFSNKNSEEKIPLYSRQSVQYV